MSGWPARVVRPRQARLRRPRQPPSCRRAIPIEVRWFGVSASSLPLTSVLQERRLPPVEYVEAGARLPRTDFSDPGNRRVSPAVLRPLLDVGRYAATWPFRRVIVQAS